MKEQPKNFKLTTVFLVEKIENCLFSPFFFLGGGGGGGGGRGEKIILFLFSLPFFSGRESKKTLFSPPFVGEK